MKPKRIKRSCEGNHGMKQVARSGYGFLGGMSFLLGAYLLKESQWMWGVLFVGIGVWLFWHGYKG